MPFKATPKPPDATDWWSNHFIAECQNLYKITANEFVSSLCHAAQFPEPNRICQFLLRQHVSSLLGQSHAVSGAGQWETAPIRTSPSFSPGWLCTTWRKNVHTCQFCQISSSHAAHQLVLHSLKEDESVKSCLWQQRDCPELSQREDFIFTRRMEGFPRWLRDKQSASNADAGLIPGLGRSPGVGNATYSSILAWKIPWTGEPGGWQSMGSQRAKCEQMTEHILRRTEKSLRHDGKCFLERGEFPCMCQSTVSSVYIATQLRWVKLLILFNITSWDMMGLEQQ